MPSDIEDLKRQLAQAADEANAARDEADRLRNKWRDIEAEIRRMELAAIGADFVRVFQFHSSHDGYSVGVPSSLNIKLMKTLAGGWKILAINGQELEEPINAD